MIRFCKLLRTTRGRREQAVRAIFGGATVIRPAVLFGLDDTFLNTLIKLMRRLPIYPMFGRGETRLQAAQDNSTFSERETLPGAGAVRCLAGPGLDRRDAARSTRHA